MNPLDKVVFRKVTIADSESLSDALSVQGYDVVAIQQPADCEGTTFSFQGSLDGSTFADIYVADGDELQVTKSATLAQVILLTGFVVDTDEIDAVIRGMNQIKIRTGLTGAATNQTGAVTLLVGLRAAGGD